MVPGFRIEAAASPSSAQAPSGGPQGRFRRRERELQAVEKAY